MPTIKVKINRVSSDDATNCAIIYQVIHLRVPRQIPTAYRIQSNEWDPVRSAVISTPSIERRQQVLAIRESIRCDVERLKKIAARLAANSDEFTADELVDEFKRYIREYSFMRYMEVVIDWQMQKGRIATTEHYRSAFNSFRKFLSETKPRGVLPSGRDMMLDRITSETMEQYEAWQKNRGLCPNTISFYLRIFRAVYRRAVEEEAIDDRHPFRRVYTGVDKTVKRALPLVMLSKVKTLDLSLSPALDYTRDMFMLSFYLRGMSFVDMAYLKKTDLKNGEIKYRRRKTSQQLTIGWTKEMQSILDKYPENDSDYLLPIIRKKGVNEWYAYRTVGTRLNMHLKEIGSLVGAPDSQNWSFYRARHSWASAARAKGIPLSVISEGMGHDSETTTQIYLASLDTSVVDRANELIISSI